MPDIAGSLKSEIARLSKKAVRQELVPAQKASIRHRHEIADLKRRLLGLQKDLAKLRKQQRSNVPKQEPQGEQAAQRFVAKGLRSLRARLELSADDFGRLVGVSGQSVYNWEHERARPQRAQIASIAAARSMGKREARRRLEELAQEPAR